ncbi:helix-turn-helix domain-containing protein [Paenibacillus sp. HJGM_3]
MIIVRTWDDLVNDMSPESQQEAAIIRKRAAMVVTLIELRVRKGWTQAELAKRARMKQSAIARFESDTTAPRIDTILRVAMALGVDLTLIPSDHAGNQQAATSAMAY